jgi:RNA polymerase primary sigma factor
MSSSDSADRVMEAYYAEIRKCTLLPADVERQLFRAYRTCGKCQFAYTDNALAQQKCPQCSVRRDFRSRDRLIEGALLFVVKVAKDYAKRARGFNHEPELLQNLVSAGNLGLLVAVDRFEPARGTRFLTYAAWWIREKILEELDNMGIVRVPAYRQKALRSKRKAGEPDTHLDPAHVTMEDVAEIDIRHKDERLERELVNTYGCDLIQQALIELGFRGRDKYIVLAYFGVKEEPKNLRQISSRLDLSSERVRQIKKDALDQLKSYLTAKQVRVTEDVFTP